MPNLREFSCKFFCVFAILFPHYDQVIKPFFFHFYSTFSLFPDSSVFSIIILQGILGLVGFLLLLLTLSVASWASLTTPKCPASLFIPSTSSYLLHFALQFRVPHIVDKGLYVFHSFDIITLLSIITFLVNLNRCSRLLYKFLSYDTSDSVPTKICFVPDYPVVSELSFYFIN